MQTLFRLTLALASYFSSYRFNSMPLLLLDRDGVINHDSTNYVRGLSDWRPIARSYDAIARASKAGYSIAIVTNQSGLARGYFDEAALEEMHSELRQQVAALGGKVDAIFYCSHGPDDGCSCRKPKPGMVLQALKTFAVQAGDAVLIGDSLRDLQAAENAGVTALLVRTGNGEKTAASCGLPKNTVIHTDLAEAVDSLLGN